jgi:hypothetical protein
MLLRNRFSDGRDQEFAVDLSTKLPGRSVASRHSNRSQVEFSVPGGFDGRAFFATRFC